MALDAQGQLWVNDMANGRVQTLGAHGRFHVRFAVPHPAQTNIRLYSRCGYAYAFTKKYAVIATPTRITNHRTQLCGNFCA